MQIKDILPLLNEINICIYYFDKNVKELKFGFYKYPDIPKYLLHKDILA